MLPDDPLGLDEAQADPDNKKLPGELQNALKGILQYVQQLDKWARRCEVIDARKQRFYWADQQYIYWNNNSCTFSTAQGGVSVSTPSGAVDMPRYMDVYNIYKPYGRGLVSVLVQNPPGVRFEPDDPFSSVDIASANAAEKYRHRVDRNNDRKRLQADISRLFWTDGRVVLFTREEDGGEKITAHGVLETKVPITANELSECTYCVLSDEVDINKAKMLYPDADIKEASGSVGESAYERLARLGVLQGTRAMQQAGDAYKHLVTRHRAYLRPELFERAPDADKATLQEMFPDGAYVVFTGDSYCVARAESMDDHLAVAHPIPGDGMAKPSMGRSLLPLQDAFNDYKNMQKEIFDYSIPFTWMDSTLGDIQAIREQMSQPGQHISAIRPPNLTSMAAAFYREPDPICPPTMMEAMESLSGELAQFITGALPALLGASDDHNETKGGIAMLRDQAMGQMSLPWGAIQELYAKAYKQACIIAGKTLAGQDVPISAPSGNVSIRGDELALGAFSCFPETDSSFPETYAAKSQRFMMLMEGAVQNPVLAQVLSLPDNQRLAKNMIGIPELVIIAAEAQEKQLGEIEMLLKSVPIPPTEQEMEMAGQQWAMKSAAASAAGQPVPPEPTEQSLMKPSVDVDPQFDYHQYEYAECQRWLSSEERRKQERNGNLAGIQNVRLHALEHFKFMQAANPQGAQ